jgi:hypothetical protein
VSRSFVVESSFARRLRSEVVSHFLDLRIRVCRNFVFVNPNRLMFRRISARPVRRDVSRPRSPFSRRSEVAIEFRFTSYLICLLPLGFRTFRSYMLLIVDPSISSFQRVCRCVGVTAVLLIRSEAKPADTD